MNTCNLLTCIFFISKFDTYNTLINEITYCQVYFIIYEIKEPWAEQNILEIAFEESIL